MTWDYLSEVGQQLREYREETVTANMADVFDALEIQMGEVGSKSREAFKKLAAIAIMGMQVFDQECVEKFHRRRRMFAIVNGELLIAPANDPRSHKQWLGDHEYLLRGYYNEQGIVYYSSLFREARPEDWVAVLRQIPHIVNAFEIRDLRTPIYAGVIVNPQRWQPAQCKGVIGDYI
jgi:hypothetical protein